MPFGVNPLPQITQCLSDVNVCYPKVESYLNAKFDLYYPTVERLMGDNPGFVLGAATVGAALIGYYVYSRCTAEPAVETTPLTSREVVAKTSAPVEQKDEESIEDKQIGDSSVADKKTLEADEQIEESATPVAAKETVETKKESATPVAAKETVEAKEEKKEEIEEIVMGQGSDAKRSEEDIDALVAFLTILYFQQTLAYSSFYYRPRVYTTFYLTY